MPESSATTRLDDVLMLTPCGPDTFQSRSRPGTITRIFGGEVAGQAALAAMSTVEDRSRVLHYAHCTFLRPGDSSRPVTYQVTRDRDGRAFSARVVEARQQGRLIFRMTASLHAPERGPAHQVPHSVGPGPEDAPPVMETLGGDQHTMQWMGALEQRLGVDLRFPEEPVRAAIGRGLRVEARQQLWMRASAQLPRDERLHVAGLAYLSDILLISTSLGPHGESLSALDVNMATLNHTIWFHSGCRVDEWLLYRQQGLWTGSARGLSQGTILDRSGTLCATTMQEGLIRPNPVGATGEH